MARRTPLYDAHVAAGARFVDFAGWEMPINYGSQIEEHHQVRREAGMFDVSHMTVVDLHGEDTRGFLSHLLANDVARLKSPGKALYSCMLNERGGVIDDLITYFMADDWFRMVVNAATRERDLDWMTRQARKFDTEISERDDLAMIAVQGPAARDVVLESLPAASAKIAAKLELFHAAEIGSLFISRTGYTGEDGFETALPDDQGVDWWERLEEVNVTPCGLGARDTLRLEAGMNLCGQDMDESVTPYESGLGWTVAMSEGHDFIGRAALESQKATGVARELRGLVLEERGVLRHGQEVATPLGAGQLTSGSFSPTLQRSIGLARVPAGASGMCQVSIRGRDVNARIVKPPFVRHGKVCDGIL